MADKNDPYYSAYLQWSTQKDNEYAFSERVEPQEHSYTAGQGYNRPDPDADEHHALSNCLRLLGGVMLIFLAFDAAMYFFLSPMSEEFSFNTILYSQRFAPYHHFPDSAVYVYFLVTVLKYVLAIILIHHFSKLPKAVIMGRPYQRGMISVNSVMTMLMIMVVGRLSSMILAKVLGIFKVDSVYCLMFVDESVPVNLVSVVLNCVALPVLIEVLFRGYVLQLFKQFGNAYAVLVSSVACALCFYDVSYMGYALCCSLILGMLTVSVGSLRLSITMHLIANSLNYVLALVGFLDHHLGRLLEMLVYLLISASSLMLYFRLHEPIKWTSNDLSSNSEIPFERKAEALFSSNAMAIWFVLVLVMVLIQGWIK